MAIVNDLNKIRDWLQANVCDKVQLKLPLDENAAAGYEYELVHPAAFALFTPTKDRLPPKVRAPIPSVCLRLLEGEHVQGGTHTMQLILNFCAWNPGTHGKDIFVPVEPGAGIKGYNQQATAEYQRTADGWQDVFSLIDYTLRALENAEYIADMRILSENGIKYGMTSDKEGLDDFYPYWLGWITFSVQGGNIRNKRYNDFL